MGIKKSDFEIQSIRINLGKVSRLFFTIIYFPQLFKSLIPDFHRNWYKLMSFYDPKKKQRFTYLILLAFRESAKSSLAKIKIVHDICYRRKKLIAYVCYEKERSGEALFDIATWLQTNKLLIKDFGNLFYSKDDEKKAEKKTINNFVTSNGIRVTAVSIRQSMRGRVFEFDRPDCYVIDDFENNVTKKSSVITRKVIDFFKELMTGLSADAEIMFLCNRVSDVGSVQWLLDTAEENKDFRVSEVAVIEDGKSVWPSKFALTDMETDDLNEFIEDPNRWVVSLESKKRTMNADGSKTFEQEMLNQAETQGDRLFNSDIIDKRIEVLRAKKWQNKDPKKPNYFKKDGNWKRWGDANPENINVVSADVSEGYGNDSSVIQVFDINESKQIAEYESNLCPPNILAKLMVEEGKKAGYCLLAPERNSIGVAVVNEIKNANYFDIYREKAVDKITEKPIHKYGWHTNSKTKPQMLFEFKRDFEAGRIEINSISLLREMRAFSNLDIDHRSFDPEISNHFDRLVACFVKGTLVLTQNGQIPIESIRVGDKVLTRKGYKKVVATCSHVKKIVTNIGLTGTPDHPVFYNENRIKDLSCISNCDKLYVWDSKAQKIGRLSYTEILNITDILIQKNETTGFITWVGQQIKKVEYTCIGKFGLIILGTFQKGILSIIKIMIQVIMKSKILSACRVQNITRFMDQIHAQRKREENLLIKTGKNLIGGCEGITKTKRKEKLIVIFAEKLLKVLLTMQSFVLERVSKEILEKKRRSQSKKKSVPFVEKHLKQVSPIKKDVRRNVTYSEEESIFQTVYNLQIEDCPEYFVNNVLVHNCCIAWQMRKVNQIKGFKT